MIKFKSLIAALALALPMLTAAPAAAQTRMENPAGAWLHGPSGITFPATSGDFKRASIDRFDETGRDVGIVYHLIKDGEAVGVTGFYIYPAKGSCETSWESVRAETDANGGSVISEDRAPSPTGKTPGGAYHAKLDLPLGGPDNPITSAGYLHCSPDGKWLVKYFASWRGTGDLEGETVRLMRAFSWPKGWE